MKEQLLLVYDYIADESIELIGVFSEESGKKTLIDYLEEQGDNDPLSSYAKLIMDKSVILSNGHNIIAETINLNEVISYAV